MRASASAKKSRSRDAVNAPAAFPPLTVSLAPFVRDGTDRRFRKLIYSLFSLMNLMQRNARHFAEYIGVTEGQVMMIARVADNPGITVSRLAEQLSVSSPFVTAEITKLVKKRIVEKRRSEADGRSMLLTLTPKGETLLRELGPLRLRTNDIMFKSLTDERAAQLQDILSALIADARIALHELEAPHMRGQRAPSVQSELPHASES